jgi:hypothetical protein
LDCAVASDGRPWPFPSLQRSVHILPRQRQLRTCYKPALQGTCALQCQRRLRSIPVLRVGSARWHGPVTKGGASGTAPHGTALHPRKGPLATSSHLPAGVHTGDSGPGAFECPIQVSHDARLLLVVSFIISTHVQLHSRARTLAQTLTRSTRSLHRPACCLQSCTVVVSAASEKSMDPKS